MVSFGFVDHQATMYKFSHFLPYSRGKVLLSHANETKNMWHEIFVHINYKYLQELKKGGMVEGIPPINSSNGACIGCVVEKHLEHNYEKGKSKRATQVLGLVQFKSYWTYPYNFIWTIKVFIELHRLFLKVLMGLLSQTQI